ncbi:MAG: hypothetical protein IPL74_05650 [Bacteroidetes bacterium]|nr:hypothetical protein [Bacteroidota bacterium]
MKKVLIELLKWIVGGIVGGIAFNKYLEYSTNTTIWDYFNDSYSITRWVVIVTVFVVLFFIYKAVKLYIELRKRISDMIVEHKHEIEVVNHKRQMEYEASMSRQKN